MFQEKPSPNERFATITAVCHPHGLTNAACNYAAVRTCSTDLPGDIIGECVTDAVSQAWKAGNDPAIQPFCVVVTFR